MPLSTPRTTPHCRLCTGQRSDGRESPERSARPPRSPRGHQPRLPGSGPGCDWRPSNCGGPGTRVIRRAAGTSICSGFAGRMPNRTADQLAVLAKLLNAHPRMIDASNCQNRARCRSDVGPGRPGHQARKPRRSNSCRRPVLGADCCSPTRYFDGTRKPARACHGAPDVRLLLDAASRESCLRARALWHAALRDARSSDRSPLSLTASTSPAPSASVVDSSSVPPVARVCA